MESLSTEVALDQARNLIKGGYSYSFALDYMRREHGFDVLEVIEGLLPLEAPANKIATAIAARDAMREARRGKPVAFQDRTRP